MRDLNWFTKFLTTFNGVAFFSHDPIYSHIELDASLQGLGAVCDNEVYSIPIALGVRLSNCPLRNAKHIGSFASLGPKMDQEENYGPL